MQNLITFTKNMKIRNIQHSWGSNNCQETNELQGESEEKTVTFTKYYQQIHYMLKLYILSHTIHQNSYAFRSFLHHLQRVSITKTCCSPDMNNYKICTTTCFASHEPALHILLRCNLQHLHILWPKNLIYI